MHNIWGYRTHKEIVLVGNVDFLDIFLLIYYGTWPLHGLIIVVIELLTQANIQASKVFLPVFYFGPPVCSYRNIVSSPQSIPTITQCAPPIAHAQTCRWGCTRAKLGEYESTFLFMFGLHSTVSA